MAVRARTFTYAVRIDDEWTATSAEGGTPIRREDAWTPEHLVLAGLARCTLTSLGYHAKLAGIEVTSSARADGTVTKREGDGRYAFIEIGVELEVSLEPEPENVRDLLANAERDCFVGASLTVKPSYAWTVNGEAIQ